MEESNFNQSTDIHENHERKDNNIDHSTLWCVRHSACAGNPGVVLGSDNQPLLGASVFWEGTTVGTGTNVSGEFSLHRVKGYDRLIASYLGFVNDTLRVEPGAERINFVLRPDGMEVEDVVVEGTMSGNFVKRDGIAKNEMISFAGLCKMACCNLAESFENSASVTVGYSDAISGARQIKMLGLAGTYTQILDENRPIMRGLSAPYGLSYTPGMWLNSIQVSKGIASVTAGHEAITGQINLEHRKPTDEERLFVNLYLDDELRPEANISTAFPVTKNKKLSSVILLHGSMDTHVRDMDHNGDGFLDLPKADQINIANKWLYTADNGAQIRWGWKYVRENRLGGMADYKKSLYDRMIRSVFTDEPLYGSEIRNRGANAYFKIRMPVGPSVYDRDEQDEMRSNFAFVVDYDHFDEDSYFGLNTYEGSENTLSANLMYNHYFTYRSSLIVGAQAHMQSFDEGLWNRMPDFADKKITDYYTDMDRDENEVGAYASIPIRSATSSRSWRACAAITTPLREVVPDAPRTGAVEHHAHDDVPCVGRSGLSFDQCHYGQYRHSGYGTPDRAAGGFPPFRPDGEGADRGRQSDADLRPHPARRRDAEFRLFPYAVLQLGDRRSGARRAEHLYLQHRRPFVHRHVPDRLLVDARRAARHLCHVPIHRFGDDHRTGRRHDDAREAAARERVQDAVQHSVRYEVPPLGIRCDGAAQRPFAHSDPERRSGRFALFAPLSGFLRAGEPQDRQVRYLCGLREYRRLPPARSDPQCGQALFDGFQLVADMGPADGPQVLCGHAFQPLLITYKTRPYMKKILLVALMAFVGIGVCPAQKQGKKTTTVVFAAEIDCEQCVNKIMNNIPSLGKGIKDVQADTRTKEITVVYDASKNDVEHIVKGFSSLKVKVAPKTVDGEAVESASEGSARG